MITISIVVYKTELDELSKCLYSLSSPLISYIYIIDNSSEKYIYDFCLQYPNIEYISSTNVGYGTGHNIAIRKSLEINSNYHLVLNSDVYFEKGVIESLIGYMNSNPDVGQVIPNVIYPNGEIQYVCRLLPTPIDLIFRRFLPHVLINTINRRFLLEFNDHKKAMNVPFHMGCFMLFRSSALKEIGPFDERYFMYTEDIDITRRMHRFYKTMYWPEVTIIHEHKAASYKNYKMLKIHIINTIRYFNKWGWIFDKERKFFNKRLLKELGYKKTR